MVWTYIHARATMAIPATLILFNVILSHQFIATDADWIDPDTPSSAHITRPLKVPPAKPSKGNSGSSSKTFKSHNPTDSPTLSPTVSPTPNPTASPTRSSDKDIPGIFHLVMSDEFNLDGRTFADGSDPKWTAIDKNDYTNDALHYYSADNAKTQNGDLVITSEAKTIEYVGFNDTSLKDVRGEKYFKSAMLQGWNKACFTGGIIEAEVQLPGKHDVGGLWPAFWLLGNMARHTYVGSTDHIWPWSSNVCTDKARQAQRINGCMKTQHYGLQKEVGRGSPEIDIFEVQPGPTPKNEGPFLKMMVGQPFMSASYQVAPGRPDSRPGNGYWPAPWQWYSGLRGGENTSLNINFYGTYNHVHGDSDEKDYWSDAVSYNFQLQQTHFEKKHRYRLEWELPDEDKGTDGYLRWFVDDQFVFDIDGAGIANGGTNSTISTEPMYIILNTAISTQWGFPRTCPSDCGCKKYDCNSNKFTEKCGFSLGFCDMMKSKPNSPQYKINWIRVYQDPNNPKHKVGCSTPERPTRKYIEAHQDMYKTKKDDQPLKAIQVGRGKCGLDKSEKKKKEKEHGASIKSQCGGPTRGTCTAAHVCECRAGWTGPHCLSPDGHDPVTYERDPSFHDLEFTGPNVNVNGIGTALVVVILTMLVTPILRRRMDEWRPLQDDERWTS